MPILEPLNRTFKAKIITNKSSPIEDSANEITTPHSDAHGASAQRRMANRSKKIDSIAMENCGVMVNRPRPDHATFVRRVVHACALFWLIIVSHEL